MNLSHNILKLKENIIENKTALYFEEVLSSFLNKNYRSSVVGLYSVLICDLIYKLQYLHEIHKDPKAKDILDTIKTKQSNNPKSPEWETKLINEINEKMNFMDTILYTNISHLRDHRNLCAHPVLTDNSQLFQPSQAIAEGHIINILTHVFTKTPLFGNNIFSTLLNDLADKKDLFPQKKELTTYLSKAYLNNCDQTTMLYLFKNLWKICFRDNSIKAIENREINIRCLSVIYDSSIDFLIRTISDKPSFYSILGERNLYDHFIIFLSEHTTIYKNLTKESQLLLKNHIEPNEDLKIISSFLSSSFNEHLTNIKSIYHAKDHKNGTNTINYLFVKKLSAHADAYGYREEFNNFSIYLYIQGRCYSNCDNIYKHLIKPSLGTFSENQIEVLLEGINENHQTSGRSAAQEDHSEIKKFINNKYQSSISTEKIRYLDK